MRTYANILRHFAYIVSFTHNSKEGSFSSVAQVWKRLVPNLRGLLRLSSLSGWMTINTLEEALEESGNLTWKTATKRWGSEWEQRNRKCRTNHIAVRFGQVVWPLWISVALQHEKENLFPAHCRRWCNRLVEALSSPDVGLYGTRREKWAFWALLYHVKQV